MPGVDSAQVELYQKQSYLLLIAAAGTTPKGSVTHRAVHRAIGKYADFIKRHRVNLQPQQQDVSPHGTAAGVILKEETAEVLPLH